MTDPRRFRALLAIASGPLENALLAALIERGHSVVLVGGAEKTDRAARWPDSVVAQSPADLTYRDEDIAVIVSDVALRGAPSDGHVAPVLASDVRARRTVLVASRDASLAPVEGDLTMIIRADAVFGAAAPDDDLVSALVAMVRALGIVPVFEGSHTRFLPVYATDLARLIVAALESNEAWGREHVVRGAELLTTHELLEKAAARAHKKLICVPLPSFLAGVGSAFARLFGAKLAIPDRAVLARLEAHATARGGETSFEAFRVVPTSIDAAIAEIADALPEQRPTDGYGALQHKRFWIDIDASALDAQALLENFRCACCEILPFELRVEPGEESATLVQGRPLDAALPVRGEIQMRVEEALPNRITLATVAGHPIAGVVRFITSERAGKVRFTVEVFARSGTPVDFVLLEAGGSVLQNLTWSTVCKRMLERSGGNSEKGVEHAFESLEEADAQRAEAWIEQLIVRREHEEHSKLALGT